MAGDVEEGLSDPAPFSRRRMRSEGLHAVEGVEVSGGCSTDFSEISTFRAGSTGDDSYCPYCPYYLLYAEPSCTSPGRICLIQVN